jgi:hypothetical protein
MSTEIRTLAVGVPQVFRSPQGRSFLAMPAGGAGGGTVLLEWSQDGVSFLPAPQGASVNPYSFCPQTLGIQQAGYVRATAAVAAGAVAASDVTQIPNQSFRQELVQMIALPWTAQASVTTEQILNSIRFPAGALPSNWSAEMDFEFSCSNNANVKTLKAYFGPTGNGGTFLASVPITSLLNGRVKVWARGQNDNVTVVGGSVGSGLGEGGGATALVSTTIADYTKAEQEFCLTLTKATAGDVVSINRMHTRLFTQ